MDAKRQSDVSYHPRVEDDALLRGAGRFVDDPRQPNQAFAVFVRSPHAHARIRSVKIDDARAANGVVAVLTAKDIDAVGVGNVARHPPMAGRGGAKIVLPHRPTLAAERVMHVGEAVAMVIGETLGQAQDAAELVAVDYEELPSIVDAKQAIEPGAPQLWPQAPHNIALDWPGPVPSEDNEREVERIIAGAAHVARITVVNQRIIVATMEPRGATGSYDAASGAYTLRACSQSAWALRGQIADIMGVPNDKLRVITEDVGGAFGLKTAGYPEYPAVLAAAKIVGRPVHWMSSRSESFVSDNHARDTVTDGELAMDENGRFLALRVRHLCNQGAFLASVGAHINTSNFARCFPMMYDIPRIDVGARCVFTNTLPIGPYRGAGRPEANYLMERLVEEAARVTGIDSVKLRRRNLIRRSAIPYKTAVGTTFDSGDFVGIFDQAIELAGVKEFPKRRRESAKRKKYRGLGVSCFLEHAGATPSESASLSFPGGDLVALGLNVQSTGQGHATVFGRLVAERLGISPAQVVHRQGDTALGLAGSASVGSRSAITAGSAIVQTIEVMLAKGRKLAATLLEAAETDIQYRHGGFEVVGTDRRLTLFEVAARAKELVARGQAADTLDTKEKRDTPQAFPNGCHVAEVEIDPDTGQVTVLAYTAVDDCGTVLDAMIVEGQIHGAVAQGLGQALMENGLYEPEGGQFVAGSFMDYAMPRAPDMPLMVRDVSQPSPATTNPLGVKGVGEAGTTAALAAIMNAVIDAVPNGAAAHLDMPATPAKVWAACRKTQAK